MQFDEIYLETSLDPKLKNYRHEIRIGEFIAVDRDLLLNLKDFFEKKNIGSKILWSHPNNDIYLIDNKDMHSFTIEFKDGNFRTPIIYWNSRTTQSRDPRPKMVEILKEFKKTIVEKEKVQKKEDLKCKDSLPIYGEFGIIDHLDYTTLKDGSIRFEIRNEGHLDHDEVEELLIESSNQDFHLLKKDKEKLLELLGF